MIDTTNLNPGIVYQCRTRRESREASVVLQSVGIPSEILPWEGHFLLIVRPDQVAESAQQLRLYFQENRKEEETRPARHPRLIKGLPGALIYVSILLLVDAGLHSRHLALDLWEMGSARAGLIQQGEWWRAVTALTLHADFRHLIGNIAFGLVFGLFASQVLGAGLAWLSILLAGMAGNILSAFIQAPSHNAIGASTAVFAALGIVATHTWITRHNGRYHGIRRWTPVIGGIMLLSLLGGPGERIDVISHITGFLSGGALGALYGTWGGTLGWAGKYQKTLGIAAVAIILVAWLAAANS